LLCESMDTTLAQLVALGQVDSEARGWCDYLARQLASNLVIVMVAAAAAAAASMVIASHYHHPCPNSIWSSHLTTRCQTLGGPAMM